MNQIPVSARVLRALLPFVSTDVLRPVMHGLFLEPDPDAEDRVTLTATDGHALLTVRVPAPVGAIGIRQVVVPAKAIATILKGVRPKDEPMIFVTCTDGKTVLLENPSAGTSITAEMPDGLIPSWRNIVPGSFITEPPEAANFAPDLLAKFEVAARLFQHDQKFVLRQDGRHVAGIFFPFAEPNLHEALGLLMPRLVAEAPSVPTWALSSTGKAVRAANPVEDPEPVPVA